MYNLKQMIKTKCITDNNLAILLSKELEVPVVPISNTTIQVELERDYYFIHSWDKEEDLKASTCKLANTEEEVLASFRNQKVVKAELVRIWKYCKENLW